MSVSILLLGTVLACQPADAILWRVPNSVVCGWIQEARPLTRDVDRRWYCGDSECDDLAEVVVFKNNQILAAEEDHNCHTGPDLDHQPPGADSGCPDSFDVYQEFRECWVYAEDWPEGVDSGGQ